MKFKFHKQFFLSEDYFQNESKDFWKECWFYVGTDFELKKKGDYFRKRVFGEDLIIILGDDNKIHCHRNNCPHRNSKIFKNEKGNSKLICQYHGGSFKFNGQCRSKFLTENLFSFKVEKIEHFIFVSSPECKSSLNDYLDGFDEELKDISALLGSNLLSNEKINHQSNWKLLIENVLEGFHCPTVHKESLLVDGICSIPFNEFKQSKKLHSSWDYPTELTPFKIRKEKKFPFLKTYSESFRAFRHIFIFPNLLISSTENYFIYVGTLTPLSSQETILEINFFRPKFDSKLVNTFRFKSFYEAACESGLKVIMEDKPMILDCFENIQSMHNEVVEYNLDDSRENRLISFYQLFNEAWKTS